MKKIIILLLIISPLQMFGQILKTTIKMDDGMIYRGRIFEYSDDEIKFLVKKEVLPLKKSEIIFPKTLRVNKRDFITTIRATDGNIYKGIIVDDYEDELFLDIGRNQNIPIKKSKIVYQTNRFRKFNQPLITSIETKNGDLFAGNIVGKDENSVTLDLGNNEFYKIDKTEIVSEYETYISELPMKRLLMVVGGIYIVPILIAIAINY